jgi:hypothetical protein
MSDVQFRMRMFDDTREAEITADRDQTGQDLIAEAARLWQMDPNVQYRLLNTTRHFYIQPEQKLSQDVVAPQDVLRLEPVLVAG